MSTTKQGAIKRLNEIYIKIMEMPRFTGRTVVTGDILLRIDFLESHKFGKTSYQERETAKIPGLILKEAEDRLKNVLELFQKKANLKG